MFIWSAIAHLIALISPGPDTAIIIRQVSLYGRSEGIKASFGIGVGIFLHCILAISGISVIILGNDLYKFILSFIGGLYILYLGIVIFYSKSQNNLHPKDIKYSGNSFIIGLITNIFNIKAFLFFVSLFSILVETLFGIYYLLFPIYFSITSTLWFIFISYFLTFPVFNKYNIFLNKFIKPILSFILCSIGTYIILRSFYEYF